MMYLQNQVELPLKTIQALDKYDVNVTVDGGGTKGQAEAIKLGISRALCNMDVEMRVALKPAGLLTRDPRVVERKKFGHKKARRSYQFSKR
jgi:small subunit ribosomal protein S9